MTIKEMYIRITSALSALGGQRNRRYSSGQIEQEIDAEVEEFIARAALESPEGFFNVSGKFLDAVRPLLDFKELTVNVRSPYEAEAYLPFDEFRILNIVATGMRGRASKAPKVLSTIRFYKIELPKEVEGSYVELNVGGEILYIRDKGKYETRDTFNLINELEGNLSNVKRSSGDAYLMVSVESPMEMDVRLVVDGTTYQATLDDMKMMMRYQDVEPRQVVPVRRIQNQMMASVQATAYYQATERELICDLLGSYLNLNTPTNFIVNSLRLHYIRRPRKVSLALGIGCDLHPSMHKEICDRTVQRIRERLGDPKFSTGLTQNSNTL